MRVWYIFYGNLALNQGPTTHFSEIMHGLTTAGVDVVGYAPALGRYAGVHADKIKINYTWTLNIPVIRVIIYDFLLLLRLICTPQKPDILYVRVAYFTLFTPLLAKLFRKKLVLEINGNVVYDVISKGWKGLRKYIPIWCEGFLHRIADRSICVSETIVEALIDYYKLPAQKLVVLNNGVNTAHFRPLDRALCLDRVGLDTRYTYVGYVGCFTGWDGIEHIVRVLPKLKQVIPQVKVLLIGDGEHKAFVEAEVARMGLQQDIIFTGYRPYSELPYYLNCFSVAVAPYGGTQEIVARNKKGGLSSLKSLEYNAIGLPVVVADIASVEYVHEFNTGFIIPQGDEQALYEKVVLLLQNEQLVKELGDNGRAYVVAHRSWQSVADKTLTLFTQLLQC